MLYYVETCNELAGPISASFKLQNIGWEDASAVVTGRNWNENVLGRKKKTTTNIHIIKDKKGFHVRIGHFIVQTFGTDPKKSHSRPNQPELFLLAGYAEFRWVDVNSRWGDKLPYSLITGQKRRIFSTTEQSLNHSVTVA